MTDAIQKAREALQSLATVTRFELQDNVTREPWKRLLANADAALDALDAETEVKVRELEWTEEFSGTWWTSEAYRIELTDGGGFAARVSHPQSRSFRTIDIFPEISAAKAAAQADYERRIRSALVPPESRS